MKDFQSKSTSTRLMNVHKLGKKDVLSLEHPQLSRLQYMRLHLPMGKWLIHYWQPSLSFSIPHRRCLMVYSTIPISILPKSAVCLIDNRAHIIEKTITLAECFDKQFPQSIGIEPSLFITNVILLTPKDGFRLRKQTDGLIVIIIICKRSLHIAESLKSFFYLTLQFLSIKFCCFGVPVLGYNMSIVSFFTQLNPQHLPIASLG